MQAAWPERCQSHLMTDLGLCLAQGPIPFLLVPCTLSRMRADCKARWLFEKPLTACGRHPWWLLPELPPFPLKLQSVDLRDFERCGPNETLPIRLLLAHLPQQMGMPFTVQALERPRYFAASGWMVHCACGAAAMRTRMERTMAFQPRLQSCFAIGGVRDCVFQAIGLSVFSADRCQVRWTRKRYPIIESALVLSNLLWRRDPDSFQLASA